MKLKSILNAHTLFLSMSAGCIFFYVLSQDTPLLSFSMKEEINIYSQRQQQEIPPGLYYGTAMYNGFLVEVSYYFKEGFVTKEVIKNFDEKIIDRDTTKYEIKGSVLYFEDTGKGVFKTFPRPFEIDTQSGKFTLVGNNVPINDFYLKDSSSL
jgi:hypothetical protein